MLVLGIETSGRLGEIALRRDHQILVVRSLAREGRRHAQTLVAEIDAVFRENGLKMCDCTRVAVSLGPGSFTGLRVGVVCAKTLAYATGCEVVGVDTYEAVAMNSPDDVDGLHVIGDAQRCDLFVARYERAAGGRRRTGEIEIRPAAKWCEARQASDVVTGPAATKWEDALVARCRVLGEEHHHPRAETVAELGARAENVDDFWTLAPLYIRRSAAEEKRTADGKG